MPSLKAQLTVKLDASSLVQTFLTNVGGPAGTLQGIADPTPASALTDVNAQLGAIDLGTVLATQVFQARHHLRELLRLGRKEEDRVLRRAFFWIE